MTIPAMTVNHAAHAIATGVDHIDGGGGGGGAFFRPASHTVKTYANTISRLAMRGIMTKRLYELRRRSSGALETTSCFFTKSETVGSFRIQLYVDGGASRASA